MKSLKIFISIIVISLFYSILPAQVSVNVNLNVPSRYFFLPDIGVYFDNHDSRYVYPSGSRWIRARVLPPSFGHFNFNTGHKIIINDYSGTRPYIYYNTHRSKFPKGKYNKSVNSWSAKEHKQYRKAEKNQFKHFQKAQKQNHKWNGNNGNNGNNGGKHGMGSGKGNGKGNGKGRGGKK